jgi:hypothetical protein
MTSTEVVSLVTALIWPAIVLTLAIFYQGAIKDLLKRLKSAQVAGFKGAFDKSAEKALDKADTALRESNVADKTVRDPATQLLINQTASQPSWAVHQAWRNIRDAALKATGAKGAELASTPERVDYLLNEGLVSQDVYELALTMRGLYDEVREEPGALTPTAASDFVEAAAKLVEVLRAVRVVPPDVSELA